MKNSKFLLIGLVAVFGIIGFLFLLSPKQTTSTHTIDAKFVELSTNGNVFCFLPDAIYSMDDSQRLRGSCCGPMGLHKYQEQIEGLKKYSNIDKIPSDPYDIPVSLAKELLEFDRTITLTLEQQKIYDDAMKMSDEGGPCCCKCWRWYVYEGLAKYLITEYNFNSEQIAEVWDLSEGCGGEEHVTGVHT